ncbi:MAG: hypothetical protein KDA96_11260, partial [Planctomycetaceae bacterium]|nr:hypothetical protein [Planctomycetaceae bacterium]
ATPVHERTLRNLRLQTELYCDRRALQVTGEADACIRTLVKMETGLRQVSAQAYLQQATEVMRSGKVFSEGVTHPEMFIRTYAIQAWDSSGEDSDQEIARIISGGLRLDDMDLLQQQSAFEMTRFLISRMLDPPWMQTTITMELARRFFSDALSDDRSLMDFLRERDGSNGQTKQCVAELQCEKLRKYFCYVLLDFATIDPELDETALAQGFQIAAEVQLSREFQQAAGELRISKRTLQRIQTDAAQLVKAAVEAQQAEVTS